MEHSLPQEANSRSTSHKIFCPSHNLKVLYHVQQPPPVPFLRHINPVHTVTPHFLRTFAALCAHLHLFSNMTFVLTGFVTKISQHFSRILCTRHIPSTSSLLIWSATKYKNIQNYNFPCFMYMLRGLRTKLKNVLERKTSEATQDGRKLHNWDTHNF